MRDRRFYILTVFLFVLQLVSVAVGLKQHRDFERERTEATIEIRRQWIEQDAKNPHAAAHYGIYVFPARTPLALLDKGVTSSVGASIFLEAHRQNQPRHRPAQDSALVDRFGELTVATILQLFFPLILIALTYSAFSDERAKGTFRLSKALGLNTREFVLGKFLGIFACIGLISLPGAVVAAIGLYFGAGQNLVSLAISGISLLLGYVLYSLTIVGVALSVSAVLPSRAAMAALCGFWVFNSIIVPILAADLASKTFPLPTVVDFYRKVRSDLTGGESGHDVQHTKYDNLISDTLKQYKVKRVEDLPFNYFGYSLQKMEEEDTRVYETNLASLRELYRRQNAFVLSFGVIAPSLYIRSYSMAFAGTDLDAQQKFAKEAESYRRIMVKTLNEYIAFEGKDKKEVIAGKELFQRIPEFHPSVESPQDLINRTSSSLAGLAAWAGMSVLLALLLASRMSTE